MKEITTILLDVDDTLLDFKKTQDNALHNAFEKYGIELTEDIYSRYNEINHGLWKQYERGEIDRNTVLYTRFGTLFSELGIDVDGVAFEHDYQSFLADGAYLLDGALQAVNHLASYYDLYVVTNGVASTQRKRLKESGLDQFMKNIFISEDLGCQKPDVRFFEHCFKEIPGLDRSKTLIIGDSLTSDILGGNNAGITTCWFNPRRLKNTTTAVADIEIHSLNDLYEFL